MSDASRVDQIIADYLAAADAGHAPDRAALLAAHPDLADELQAFFADADRLDRIAPPAGGTIAFAEASPAEAPTLAPATPPDLVGSRVRYVGDYELLDEIARGGMGVVYKARQVSLNRVVAVKMILSGQFASAADVRRFRTEAEAAACLDHPNIVPIYEVGEFEGQQYFSMGYVEGGSLADRLASGPLPPRDAVALVRPLAEAVQFAHDRGVVHRDLKPGNILLAGVRSQESGVRDQGSEIASLTPDACLLTPKITDFGLAKHVQKGDGPTATGDILGTPAYMPPEQAGGTPALVGPLADVYSLGAVLYATLTGRPPYQAATPLDTLMKVLTDEPERPSKRNPAVPRDLETICLKCLEKRPDRRYGSARELADDLGRFLAGEPVRARPAGRLRRTGVWLRKRPWAVSGIVSLALLVAACLSYGLWAEIRERGWTILLLKARVARQGPAAERGRALELLQRAASIRPDHRLFEEALSVFGAEELGPRTLFPRDGSGDDPLKPADRARLLEPFTWDRAGRRLFLPGAEFDAATGRCTPLTVTGAGPAIADPTGAALAAVDAQGKVVLVDRATGRRQRIDRRVLDLKALRFSPDGRRLAVVTTSKGPTTDQQLELWDVAGEGPPVVVAGPVPGRVTMRSNDGTQVWLAEWVVRFSADGERLAWWHPGRQAVAVSRAGSGRVVAEIPVPPDTDPPQALALCPDGSQIAWREGPREGSGDVLPQLVIRDVATGGVVRRLPTIGRSTRLAPLAYTPDGRFIVGREWGHLFALSPETQRGTYSVPPTSQSIDRVLVWDPVTGELIAWFVGASFAEGQGPGGELAIVRGHGEWDVSPLAVETLRPKDLTDLAARVTESGLGPSMRLPESLSFFRLDPLNVGWPALLAFLAFMTVNASSLERYRHGRAMPPALAKVAALVGGVAVVWALMRLLAVFDVPDWSAQEVLFASVGTFITTAMGANAVWYGVRNLHSARSGDNTPVIKPMAPMAQIDRAGAWGARVLVACQPAWLLFVFIAALDGNALRLGLAGIVLSGAIGSFLLITMLGVPLALFAYQLAARWPALGAPRLCAWLAHPRVATVVWTLTALTAAGYLTLGVERRIADRAWENLSAPSWGLDFALTVGPTTLRSLALTVAVVVLVVSLARLWQIARTPRSIGMRH
ncbi:MAG: protein kinase [Gemmataceae bacterium]